jgi:hypothetical protein
VLNYGAKADEVPLKGTFFPIIVSCQRHGIDPLAYMTDLLRRIPAMTNQDDLDPLLPKNWKPDIASFA